MTGQELRKAREIKKITQQRLGKMLGYKDRNAELMVQHWEHDRRPIPVNKFRKLSEILELPLEKFIP